VSITFTCDGCGVTGEQGTITGGFPGQWTVAYDYTTTAPTRGLRAVLHYCLTCREAGKDRRTAAAPTPAPTPAPTTTPAAVPDVPPVASATPDPTPAPPPTPAAAPAPPAPRRRRARPRPRAAPVAPPDDDDQGTLF